MLHLPALASTALSWLKTDRLNFEEQFEQTTVHYFSHSPRDVEERKKLILEIISYSRGKSPHRSDSGPSDPEAGSAGRRIGGWLTWRTLAPDRLQACNPQISI